MITFIIDFFASVYFKQLLIIVALMILAVKYTKAQTAAGDVFTTLTFMPTTFGWMAPAWVKKTDSAAMLVPYMRVQRATDSIIAIKNMIAAKLDTSRFTKVAMVSLGMLSATDAAATYYPLVGNPSSFLTSASISGKLDKTDTAAMLSPYLRKIDTTGKWLPNANSGITAGTYMGATFNSKGLATSGSNPTIDTLSALRAFNTAYKLSTTQYVMLNASARITCNLSLTGGQEGSITLQTSPDASTWTSVGTIYNSNTGSLTIGLNTSQSNGGLLSCLLMPNYFYKLLTTNVTGSPTYTMQVGNRITY